MLLFLGVSAQYVEYLLHLLGGGRRRRRGRRWWRGEERQGPLLGLRQAREAPRDQAWRRFVTFGCEFIGKTEEGESVLVYLKEASR